jgi:hypothetical protein
MALSAPRIQRAMGEAGEIYTTEVPVEVETTAGSDWLR